MNMEEKAILQQTAVTSLRVHIISQTLHCSIVVVCGLLRLLCWRRSPHTTVIWTRSELTAVYWKHLSRMPPDYVVAGGDVKRSTGGSITTSIMYDMLQTMNRFTRGCVELDNCSCPIAEHSRAMALIKLSCACKRTDCIVVQSTTSIKWSGRQMLDSLATSASLKAMATMLVFLANHSPQTCLGLES